MSLFIVILKVTYRQFERYAVLGLCFYIVLSACSSSPTKESKSAIPEPIERTWAEIKESGVIRMITRYNSSSYFLHRGIERGFEYEFAKHFSEENNLALEIVIQQPGENPLFMLNEGRGDFIAANFSQTQERAQFISFSEPYNMVSEVVVFGDLFKKKVPSTLEELDGWTIAVRRQSSYFETLQRLKRDGYGFKIAIVDEETDTESLLLDVSRGEREATVADNNLISAAQSYIDGLFPGPVISEQRMVSWALRKNNPQMLRRMNRFMNKHFRLGENDQPKRSAFLGILNRRYFEDSNMVSRFREPLTESPHAGLLSPYDLLVQRLSPEYDLDWKLVVAIMAQESKFNPYAESWAGAVGLMQVIPRFTEFSAEQLFDEEVNLREGMRIIKEHLSHYEYMDSTNKIAFALATYNAGFGHMADARRLAIDSMRDPNDWEDVSISFMRLMKRQYYQNARYGFARGIETVRYVKEIMNRYRMYDSILSLQRGDLTMLETK